MKIAVCGKGGSGKSTIVAVLAGEFQRRNQQVLVVDSDESNSGLHWMLGIAEPPKPLIEFVGGKGKVLDKMATGYTAETESLDLALWRQNEITMDNIPVDHLKENQNCRLVITGKIGRLFEGCACPMGVVTREFLKKLRVENNQLVIVDMEAGVEHFGRGIEANLDAALVVVEPSLESLVIAEKTRDLAESAGLCFTGAVVNKIRSGANRETVIQELKQRGIPVLGGLRFHERLLDDGLSGRAVNPEVIGTEAGAIVDRLTDFIQPARH